jgi:hypothetical protein
MPKRSAENRIVRKGAKNVSPPSAAEIARIRAVTDRSIDTSEISERRTFRPLKRDLKGALPRRTSMIRDAIEKQRRQLHLTVYSLWKKARAYHPLLSQSAVHEFLKGQRELELPSAEALLTAVELRIVMVKENPKKEPSGSSTRARKHPGSSKMTARH